MNRTVILLIFKIKAIEWKIPKLPHVLRRLIIQQTHIMVSHEQVKEMLTGEYEGEVPNHYVRFPYPEPVQIIDFSSKIIMPMDIPVARLLEFAPCKRILKIILDKEDNWLLS